MTEHHIWQTQAQHTLENKAAALTDKQRKRYQIDFIMAAILKVPAHTKTDDQFGEFKRDTEELIAAIPTGEDQEKSFRKNYAGKFSAFKYKVMRQYKLVPNGYYTGIFVSIGIAIGTSLGIMMKNLALGIAIGVAVGVAIGAAMNTKAQKEDKVL